MDALPSQSSRGRDEAANLGEAIYTLDAGGRILSINESAAILLGYAREELVSRSILDLLAPEERERTAARLALRFRSGGVGDPFIVDIVDRSGRRHTIEVTSRVLVEAGKPPRLEGLARDVSDRKRADDALRTLAAMTAQGGGEDFFNSISRHVAEALRVKYALIGVLEGPPDQARVTTVAVWAGDRFLPSLSMNLRGSPCAGLFEQDMAIHAAGFRDAFPGSESFLDGDAESFVGLPLRDTDARPIGLLALFDTQPFEPTPLQQDMLRILAARVGAEIGRLRATAALRASEQRFRQLAEHARDVLWAVELPGWRLSYLSPAFERITGIPPSQGLHRVRQVLSLIDPEDRRRVVEAAREALRHPSGAYAIEYRIAGADGHSRWIFDQGVVTRDPQGRPTQLSGVARDITSRKQAEIALAAERARFRDLFENSPDAIFVDSFDGQVLDVNAAACSLHRLPRERLVGRPMAELVPERLREEFRAGFDRLVEGEQTTADTFIQRSDATVVPVELRGTRVTLNGGRHAILLHVRDMSARRRAEDYLAGQKRILEWIATGRPVSDVLAELVRVTEARHHGLRCWVLWFPDDFGPHPAILAPTFQTASVPLLAALARARGGIGQILASSKGEPTVTREIFVAQPEARRLERLEQTRWDATIVVPVVSRDGRRLGAFTAFLERGLDTSDHLLDLHRLAASLAGVAIERHLADASLRDGAERLRRANSALLELARSELISQGDLHASLREITAAAARGIGVSRVNIWLFEDNDTLLRCVSLCEAGANVPDHRLVLRVADFPAYFEAVTRDRMVSVTEVENDPRTLELVGGYFQPLGIRSILDAGIRLRGRLIGIICFDHQGPPRSWKSEEELFAGSVADIIALAVQAGERRCIEDALRQSEEAYRSVVAALAEGVMLVNRDGTFVTFNDSAAEILGLTADYLRSHRLTDDSWNAIRQDGTRLDATEFPAFITLRTGQPLADSVLGVRRPDGRLVWLSINTRPFARDDAGQVTSVVVSFADITRRQEAEHALREGHRLLKSLSDLQARFIADSDPAATFRNMLQSLVSLTHSDTGLIGEVVWSSDGSRELQIHSLAEGLPADAPAPSPSARDENRALASLLDAVLNAAEPVVRHLPRPADAEASTEPSPAPGNAGPPDHFLGLPLQHDEEVVGVVGLGRRGTPFDADLAKGLHPLLITCANLIGAIRLDRQRAEAEARIRQLNAELEQRVEERTADLRSTNEELAEFAYVVTHDLKAPLRGIHQLSEWLSQDHAARLDSEGLRLLGLLRDRVNHLQRMIDGLLACARVARSPELESSVATLPLVHEVTAVLAPPANVVIDAAPDLPVIRGNPDRLYQIFQNLLENAVKYLDKPAGRIQVSANRRRGLWEFRVTDNGPGIPHRYHEKVFQIFQRLDTSGQIPGTGLGLTLVKRIVESRGGHIWIETPDTGGTTVCFTWPDRARRRALP